jgi:hypothetical protein
MESLCVEIDPQKEKKQRSELGVNSVCAVNEDTAQGIYMRILSNLVVAQIL